MADNKPTTVKGVVNPRDITWPFDEYGFTSMLKKEGVRAVGRIKGDDAKMEVFAGVLQALAAHARAKVADQKKANAMLKAAAENRQAAAEVQIKKDAEADVKRLEQLAADARANFEATSKGAADAE